MVEEVAAETKSGDAEATTVSHEQLALDQQGGVAANTGAGIGGNSKPVTRWMVHDGELLVNSDHHVATPPPAVGVFGCIDSPPEAATVIVPVRIADAELALQPALHTELFGTPLLANVDSRDDVVLSVDAACVALLGEGTPWHSFLAGEWVEPGLVWRVVLCLVGGPLRADMRTAAADGAAICTSHYKARWTRSDMLSAARDDAIAAAVIARACVFVRPGPLGDARLRVGRGGERWVAESLDAAASTPRAATQPEATLERIVRVHDEVRDYLKAEARRLRADGDTGRADFFESCANRVEPVPVNEFPQGLLGDELSDADAEWLATSRFRRDTAIHRTDPPPRPQRPTSFPSHLPTPTCHADFCLKEVVDACLDWHEAAERWHRERLGGKPSARPKGKAWGLDAVKPEWRPFFAAGGMVIFDEHSGAPSVLTDETYPLAHGIESKFARNEFADLKDKEITCFLADGICLKAKGLPFVQVASNLESLYEANDATGVHSVAKELHEFGKFDGTGWYLRAPRPDRAKGVLPLSVLPTCNSPIGAVLKGNGSTRIVMDMGYGYGQLKLEVVTEAPLPRDDSWLGGTHAPDGPRPAFSSITKSGGGGLAMPVNVAAGPSKPMHGETYKAGGRWPWPYEGKSSIPEQVHNDMILLVPARRAGLFVFHLLWDMWKCFHQTNYHYLELIATSNIVPELLESGDVAPTLRGTTSGRMAMGGLFASGICQREGNASDWAIMRRFDRRQEARRRSEPEAPGVQAWLDERASLEHDDYGTQARLCFGGWYSDDPKYSVCGPPSRVGDLVHSVYEVVGPDGLNFKLAEHCKWLVSSWAAWQGIRMSAELGIVWLPPAKAIRADADLRTYVAGHMPGADFVKMMGFLNYLAEVLVVHRNLNRLLWDSYDNHKEACECNGSSVGVATVQPSETQRRVVKVWRRIVMNTPGTTMLRMVRRAPPPKDNITLWDASSDACMDVTKINGVVVAKRGNLPGEHDPPGMGGYLHGLLWQYAFTAEEIEVVTIPIAEFMAGPVGLMVYDHEGLFEHAERIALSIDAEATPRGAIQGEAHKPGLLIAHDEFVKTPVYKKYKSRLTAKHAFGKCNDPADGSSRHRNKEAERMTRFLGLEPRWLPVPPEALAYIRAVVARLLERRSAMPKPKTCDPAVAGGTAPRFGSRSPRTSLPARIPGSPPSRVRSPRAHASTNVTGSPCLAKKLKGRHSNTTPDGHFGYDAPPALSAGLGVSPQMTRTTARLHSPPPMALNYLGRARPLTPAGLLLTAAATIAGPSALPPLAATANTDTGTASFVVQQRVDFLMAQNARSTKPHAFRGNQEQLRELLTAQINAQARAANENSKAAEDGHFRLYWKPYCDLQLTPYLRPDVDSLNFEERLLEEAWWGGCVPWVAQRMPNQAGVVGAALPSSILKVPRNIRRWHKRQGINTVSLKAAVQATDGLLKDFMIEHGPLALVPKRQEPLLNEEIADIFVFAGTLHAGSRKAHQFEWTSPRYSSLLAMFHTLAQTGMRKAEVSLPPKAKFDRSRLSMLNVRWRIGGVVYDHLTPELYRRLQREGGYALLRPPPSKADPFSLHWGPCTIYLRYSATEKINAARELAREEMRRAVDPTMRESQPLFITEEGTAWRHHELAATFRALIVAVRGEERAKHVSMHSWRVYLACALLAKGASFATIQTMLRWRSEDALRIYARINDFKYADWLSAAQGATISSVRTTTAAVDMLSQPPDPGTLAGSMRDAALAGVTAATSTSATSTAAASSSKTTASMPPTPTVGMRVSGRFEDLETGLLKWDPGTITKVYRNGNLDIEYDDNEKESNVKVTWDVDIRLLEPDKKDPASAFASVSGGADTEAAKLAEAMREAARHEHAGAAEAGFCDVWRAKAATAIDAAVREARARREQPEVDAYGRLEGLHGSMSALLLEAERADEADNAAVFA